MSSLLSWHCSWALASAAPSWHYWRMSARAFVQSMGISVPLVLARVALVKTLGAAGSLAVDVGLCLIVTVVATLLNKPADMDILVKFYARIRPWGFWGPVRREAVRRGLVPARDKMPAMDALNGILTAVFQLSLALLVFYAFLRKWTPFGIWVGVAAALAVLLYFTWYKNLPSRDES